MAVQFKRSGRQEWRPSPPLDQAALSNLALHYVGRYATSQARLAAYLRRKIRERGWEGDPGPDVEAVVARLAELHYVDDAEFARVRAAGLRRRGLGPARIKASLTAAGISREIAAPCAEMTQDEMLAAARAFAARRRFAPSSDPREQRRQFSAMVRAGYTFDIARAALQVSGDAESP
jgi:regulatory protein